MAFLQMYPLGHLHLRKPSGRTTRAKAISSDIFFFVYASLYRGLIIHQGFPFNILLELMPFIGDIIVALFGGKTIDDKRVETV